MRHLSILLLCSLCLITACDDEDADGPLDAEDFTGLFEARPYGVAVCDQPDGQLQHRREVRLFRTGDSDIKPYTASLQRYFKRHDLQFFTRYAPEVVTTGYALDTDLLSLERAARRALPGIDLSDDSVLTPAQEEALTVAVTNQMLSPLVAFAEKWGRAGAELTNIVLLPQLIRPGGEDLLGEGEELAGLAVSPALLAKFAAANSDEGRIWSGVKFPHNFTPMMFVNKGVLDRATRTDEVARDLVVAHEFGHTGALVHVEEANNLMLPGIAPGTFTCADKLNPAQILTLRQTFGIGGETPVAQALVQPAPASWAPGQRLREIKRLLRGEPGPIPSFLRPLLHTHRPIVSVIGR